MRFRTVVELGGKTATGFEVPSEAVASLGTSKKPAVKVKIGAYSYRSTVASMGGRFMLPLSAENRQGAGVAAGEEIEVELELDTEPRELEVPEDFSAALGGVPASRSFFDGLSYSNKRRIVLAIDGAKTAETRQRRIEKAVQALSESRIP
ncbi:YdeI/OmpD-associated family protein [Paenibacillus lignilyticus]|uniref:DUF1905 domain-containing protein n=1 Tax=Paenibacillus lignilyticus TaxID=1172615 RepID=A0ABS5CJJ0_9BACL|nr:YdeI/OmpD-associated family protein [Paenibacillus lignilyticus]MBP3966042.1 DUF1905 domain-containing protein [Paenibacillus lignilyticus]